MQRLTERRIFKTIFVLATVNFNVGATSLWIFKSALPVKLFQYDMCHAHDA